MLNEGLESRHQAIVLQWGFGPGKRPQRSHQGYASPVATVPRRSVCLDSVCWHQGAQLGCAHMLWQMPPSPDRTRGWHCSWRPPRQLRVSRADTAAVLPQWPHVPAARSKFWGSGERYCSLQSMHHGWQAQLGLAGDDHKASRHSWQCVPEKDGEQN